MTTLKFAKSTIAIPSAHEGWNLDVWRYLPNDSFSKPYPVIIMAHGLSGTKMMRLGPYAEAFAASGYACIVFDYRHWGTSDGTPRWIVSVKDQLDDYSTVIKWARQQEQFDPHRLILWGTSFSGGHVTTLSAQTSINPAAAIAQCPFLGVTPAPPLSVAAVKTIFYAFVDSIKQMFGFGPVYIPVVAPPNEIGGLTTEGSVEGFNILCEGLADVPNKMNASAIFQIMKYKPNNDATKVSCPLLVVEPEGDNLCPLSNAENVVNKIAKGEIFKIPGAGHFDLYPNAPHFGVSLSSQLKFLEKVVPV